ncbi:MAG TPA: cytochrome b N-terminal domain-containing protein [Candidatus Thermoplasmatota archaeon]|nr:cytochrome b N-terminal domain-containing protein [Candidatus Thermoplasmatota archaeon]
MATELVRDGTVARTRRISGSQRMALAVFAWLDERFRIRRGAAAIEKFYYQINLQLPRSHTEKYKLRSIWYWYPMYTLGSISLLAFLIAAISGVLLTLYYIPSTTAYVPGQGTDLGPVLEPKASIAWQSVGNLMLNVPFGFMIRAIHFWAAMVMVAAVFLHMFRTYLTQAYKKPRELNWFVGVVLFLLTILLGYSGYLLPWSQLSYWAATIGLEMSNASPIIGKWLAAMLFGGTQLGAATVTRMYVLHVILLPMITFGVIALHIAIVWLQGIAEPH